MKQYIYNVWIALTGSNPFRKELDDVRAKYEKTAENYSRLQELYFKSLENNETVGKREKSLQQLVENLRERIADKERELEQQGKEYRDRIERMKADYQQRIEKYNQDIDRLKNPGK